VPDILVLGLHLRIKSPTVHRDLPEVLLVHPDFTLSRVSLEHPSLQRTIDLMIDGGKYLGGYYMAVKICPPQYFGV